MQVLNFPIRGQKLSMQVQLKDHLFHKRSPFQTLDIYDTEVFGRALFLDGHIQLTTFDEFAYHEALVQIPILNLNLPKSALVVGGGDGGVLRELCKHKSLERIDIVEIDIRVVHTSQEFLPTVSAGAFHDPRVNLFVEDAFQFIKDKSSTYDLIIADSTDTYENEEGGLSDQLFTETFYRDCSRALTENGIVVTQADNPIFCPYSLESIRSQFQKVFPIVGSYLGLVPSFGGYSAFCYGSNKTFLSTEWNFNRAEIPLKYLNEATYNLAFSPIGLPG